MPRILRAGRCQIAYENGEFRALKWDEIEVLRRVHGAVRDRNWGTVPLELFEESVEENEAGFRVNFRARHRADDSSGAPVHFEWRGEIVGTNQDGGTVDFRFEGRAHNGFWRNRIGLCVLHPMEVAGARVRLETSGGARHETQFPQLLAPHCPFGDLREIAHEIAPQFWARLRFEGDVFQTEDQRNWTDASFKTYSTPLEIPFPVWVEAGSTVSQTISLRFEGTPPVISPAEPKSPLETAAKNARSPRRFPLGVAWPLRGFEGPLRNLEPLRALQLSHLRVDLGFDEGASPLANALEAARFLGCALEVAFFGDSAFGDSAFGDSTQNAATLAALQNADLASFLVLGSRVGAIDEANFARIAATLRARFGEIPLGAGSNANFVELNRARPPQAADFVVYAANPQVHAFDETSILETPPALAQTLATARSFANGRAVKISPLTFAPRFNAVATDANSAWPAPDPRLQEELGAKWAAACWAALENQGLGEVAGDSLTLCEAIGENGILRADGSPTPIYEFLRTKCAAS